ncbi:MAG: hypothetical protein K9H15_11955 [Bacteroidales bacterium]|nr:hypothetical protein [Bacteroidales bacterium]MCF8351873.1 hypothetical protein [Bacteroidales bacterium]
MENKTKKVLGLDIGTNSIGGALLSLPKEFVNYGNEGKIEWLGSRIIPLDGEYLQKFESGAQGITKAANRRQKRGSRRLKHRYKLRRTRLLKVFKLLDWIPDDFLLDDSREYKSRIKYDDEFKRSHHISKLMPFSNDTVKEFEREFKIEGNKSKKGKSIVPEDWIIYYLRKKALSEKITIPELVRIIYMLNQRRGFKSSRKDLVKNVDVLSFEDFEKIKNDLDNAKYHDREFETKFVSITTVNSVKRVSEEKDKKGNIKFSISVEDSRIQDFEILRKKEPDWKGKEFTFLVEQKIKKGKFNQLQPKTPTENDWGLCTTALDEKIDHYRTPGEYFYEQIKVAYLSKQNFKARQFPVYRWRYEKELEAIWRKQCELNPELDKLNKDKNTLTRLAEILYPTQAKYKMPKLAEFQNNDLLHILSKDIIYYQRELKSQKNSIGECRYEKRIGKEKDENGKWIESGIYGLKCIPRSSPLFQEFRIWQDIHNIRIFKKEQKVDGKTKIDVDETSQLMDDPVKDKLFDLFNAKSSISENDILKFIRENNGDCDIVVGKSTEKTSHRINLFANREALKGNEIKARYRSIFKNLRFDGEQVLSDKEKLLRLWHIDYSITSSDKQKSEKGIMKALGWEKKNDQWIKNAKWEYFSFPKNVALELTNLPELKKEYGSYSALAIKKFLPLMRAGKYWQENEIEPKTKRRIEKIITGEFDQGIDIETRKKIHKWERNNYNLSSLEDFHSLPVWLAGYVVYGIHSEKDREKIKSVEEFSKFILKEIPNNSLRNPIVEQVVKETMFLVRDIWKKYGAIDEIHIELGRNLKNNVSERKKISESQKDNHNEKQRIKKILYELMNDEFEQYVDEDESKSFEFIDGKFNWKSKIKNSHFDVRPNPESPVDINKFRIWKNLSNKSDMEWAKKVKDEKIPTDKEIKKYALWLSQNCRSPYTGRIIPLSKLFDKNQYEIEHVIPRARMKNDSFNNLIISEAAINPEPYKGNNLARNFITQFGGKEGREYVISGKKYFILGENHYEAFCKETFKYQKAKLKNLLATEVPNDFVERQLNDTRYIGRKLAELLAPVAKSENGIIFTGGAITSELKNNWGLNDIWKKIIKERFKRLEKITGNSYIVSEKDEYGNPVLHFNVKENPELNTKRIDHRHHALDALIVAATTREHIRYLNTLNAANTDEEIKKIKRSLVKGKIRKFKKPWDDFSKDAKEELEKLIVSFKTNDKIISKPQNRTAYYKVVNGKPKKDFKPQKENKRWMAVRKSMFKEPLGIVWIKEIKEVSVLEAIKTHIDKRIKDIEKENRKTASYVYDKQARQVIDDLVNKSNFSLDEKAALLNEIESYIEKNSRKIPTGKVKKNGRLHYLTAYNLNGIDYTKIKIARFVPYKTKKMALTKKDYVEKLNVEKMKNDFPYFYFVSKKFFDSLSREKQTILEKAGIEISKMRKPNAFNQLFLEHILDYYNDAKQAFSTEGIEKLNKKAVENPHIGKEIKSVTRLDGIVDTSDMFNGGFYETDKGSNVYFVMYEDQQTKIRNDFISIPTHKAIEKVVNGESVAEDKEGFDKIVLTPGDLVYVPTPEERTQILSGFMIEAAVEWSNNKNLTERIYKVVSFTGKELLCLKANIADYVFPYNRKKKNKGEIGWDNKSATTMEGDMIIKEACIKLKVDRLGNIERA